MAGFLGEKCPEIPGPCGFPLERSLWAGWWCLLAHACASERASFQGLLGELGQVGGGEARASIGLKDAQWMGGRVLTCPGTGREGLGPVALVAAAERAAAGARVWVLPVDQRRPAERGPQVPPRQGPLEVRGPWQEEAGGGLTGARGKGRGHGGTPQMLHLLG